MRDQGLLARIAQVEAMLQHRQEAYHLPLWMEDLRLDSENERQQRERQRAAEGREREAARFAEDAAYARLVDVEENGDVEFEDVGRYVPGPVEEDEATKAARVAADVLFSRRLQAKEGLG
jgi:hypothetical protein